MVDKVGIGNELNRVIQDALSLTFAQGELAQLSHSSFDQTATIIHQSYELNIEFEYPIGYKPTKEPMIGKRTYKKDELIERYAFLAHTQIPTNGIYQLVIIVEAMLADLIRKIVLKYLEKLGFKRQITLKDVLESNSLQELHLVATDSLLNDLGYKSPKDFAEAAEEILSINFLECAAYHKYVEMKATRDVLIHNQGIANNTYIKKTESHARVRVGEAVPIDQIYFLEVYEACLTFIEWLEERLHEKWHSGEYEKSKEEREK